MTRVLARLLTLTLAIALLATACGADDSGDDTAAVTTETTDSPASSGATDNVDDRDDVDVVTEPDEADAGAPIPVEPDGGIGDGAGPIPGTEEEPEPEGDWHGAQVAETNCPGTDFQRVQASMFSFSVPVEFADQLAQGIDSEIAIWASDSIEASFDYGWYSSPLSDLPGAETLPIEYSGVAGEFVVVRDNAGPNGRNLVGVYFENLTDDAEDPNRLNLVVQHERPEDEIIGRCIVGSIEWN